MKREEFIYQVHAEMIFTPKEVTNMMLCSKHHYDDKCKMAGEHGGFLYGMNNVFVVFMEDRDDDYQPSYSLDIRQVDTLCKILESREADQSLAWNMRMLGKEMNEEYLKLNPG